MINAPLPWHLQQFEALPHPDGLHHGLMITGAAGIGKREYGMALAQRILCLERNPSQCGGRCQSCVLFNAGSHPDMHVLCTELETAGGRLSLAGAYSNRYQDIPARERRTNPSQVIPVDQVRLLIDRISQSSHISGARVALIVPADRMNMNAANALLKLLEEPPENSFLLLVTDQPESLPATVLSRCLVLDLESPAPAAALAWLGEQDCADSERAVLERMVTASRVGPLAHLELLRSGQLAQAENNIEALTRMLAGRGQPLSLAAILAKQDISAVLGWLQVALTDLVRWQGAGQRPAWLENGNCGAEIAIGNPTADGLFALYAKIGRYRRMARDQLNAQLVLEDVLIGMRELFESR